MKKLLNATTLYLAIGIAIFCTAVAVAAPFKTDVVNRVSVPEAISDLSAR